MKRLLLAGMAVLALTASGAAAARVNVDIAIGVPGVVYAEPDYYYGPPPVRYVAPPPYVVVVPGAPHYRHRHYAPPRHYREAYRGPRHYGPPQKVYRARPPGHGHHRR